MSSLFFFAIIFLIATPASAVTWATETVESDNNVGTDPSFALDSSGNPHISYYNTSATMLKYARWTGAAWAVETVDSVRFNGTYTAIALDNSGNPRISYYANSRADLRYASWNGASWDLETVDSTGTVGSYTSLALDSSGNPRISYYNGSGGDLKYASWNGLSWDLQTVDSTGTVGTYTSLRLDSSGNPRISYIDSSTNRVKYASWNGLSWDISSPDYAAGSGTSLRLDSSGNPHIAYTNYSSRYLKYASWNGAGWDTGTVSSCYANNPSLALDSSGHPQISYSIGSASPYTLTYARYNGTSWYNETIGATGNDGRSSSLQLSGAGNPRIAFYYGTGGDLMYTAGTPLAVHFSASPAAGTEKVTSFTFTDESTGTPTAWNWSFGDGNFSTLQNPAYTYPFAGTFTVNLTAGDSGSTNMTSRAGYITVNPPAPVAGFTGTPVSGTRPLSVAFTDTSSGVPTAWNWSFGDGNFSTLQNPSHTFAWTGTFSVSLNASNAWGFNTLTRANYITTGDPYTTVPGSCPESSSDMPRSTSMIATSPGGIEKQRLTFYFNQPVSPETPFGIATVQVTTVGQLKQTDMIVQDKSYPTIIDQTDQPAAGIIDIRLPAINPSAVEDRTISFALDESWLAGHGLSPPDAVMVWNHNGAWTEIPTTLDRQGGSVYYYHASTPEFSTFAITPLGVPPSKDSPVMNTGEELPFNSPQESNGGPLMAGQQAGTSPADGKGVADGNRKSETAPALQEPAYRFPVPVIALAAVLIAVLGTGGFLARRWWIRRQNPALFSKD